MENEYATEFGVKYDGDVLGGKPVYIIHLSGKDGCLAIGNTKKKECEIRNDTLEGAERRCSEIQEMTLAGHEIAKEMRKELRNKKGN